MKAEETFSSLKKTMKSKFISEASITEEDRKLDAVKPIEEEQKPLFFQLKENRAKNEAKFDGNP
jgi:hypothetical protein